MAIDRGRNRRSYIAMAAALLTVSVAGWPRTPVAEDYPSRAVRIVVPFPAGGPLDFTARALAEHLSNTLKQPFIVDNRAGATGNIGTEIVARATPDGHTLLFVLDTVLTANPAIYRKLPFDAERDFRPISIVATFRQMLVVHPSLSVNSLAEFVALAKKQPVNYGSGGGNGNPGHLTMEYLRLRAGFQATNVPYRGAPQVTADLLAGQFPVGFLATPAVLPHVRTGKLKPLGISSPQRSSSAPEVPAIAESYPGFDVGFYLVLLAPAATPEAIRARLEREVREALSTPVLRSQLQAQELELIGSTSHDAATSLKAIAGRWREVIQEANITAD
jgi:tripartite-type tricarboxylate transporter receptor subunit TctC